MPYHKFKFHMTNQQMQLIAKNAAVSLTAETGNEHSAQNGSIYEGESWVGAITNNNEIQGSEIVKQYILLHSDCMH